MTAWTDRQTTVEHWGNGTVDHAAFDGPIAERQWGGPTEHGQVDVGMLRLVGPVYERRMTEWVPYANHRPSSNCARGCVRDDDRMANKDVLRPLAPSTAMLVHRMHFFDGFDRGV